MINNIPFIWLYLGLIQIPIDVNVAIHRLLSWLKNEVKLNDNDKSETSKKQVRKERACNKKVKNN